MGESYRAQVGAVLEALAEGLAPFVDRQMRAHLPDEDWIVTAATRLGKREPLLASPSDPQFQLEVMVRWWGPVFARVLSKDTRDTVQALRQARNDWAHIDESHPIDLAYARRIHALVEDLLEEIGSPMVDQVSRLQESLERAAAREVAREQGISETKALVRELTKLQEEREALTRKLIEATEAAKSAAGRQRATARQLAEIQAQYAAVAGLRERYRQLERDLEEARKASGGEVSNVGELVEQLAQARSAAGQLQDESTRLHAELERTREQLETLDPIETEIGRRWVMLMTALLLILAVAIVVLAVAARDSGV